MKEEIIPIEAGQIFGESARLKSLGFRLVTLTCLENNENGFDIIYHFDRDLTLRNLRITLAKGRNPTSISPFFFAAFLVENEIQDHFGLKFDGLVLDYDRTLFLDPEAGPAPLCKNIPAPTAGTQETE